MRYITDDIGTVVAAMRTVADADPYYFFGHRLSIANILLNKNIGHQLKYPMVALRLDTPEDIVEGFQHYNLNIVIATQTKKDIRESERLTTYFKPILYPLYESFMRELKKSGLFSWEGNQKYPPHTKTDRYFFGTTGAEANEKYIFSDALDAIEITNLKINSTNKC
jgi:hypothetical protein